MSFEKIPQKRNCSEECSLNEHYDKRIAENFIQVTSDGEKNTYTIYFDEEIVEPNKYREVCRLLLDCNTIDTVILIINTIGGSVPSTLQIIDHIKLSKANVIARVYEACSSGSILMLACDEVYLSDYATVFIHSVSSECYGKLQEMVGYAEYEKEWASKLIRSTYKNFLTEDEIEAVLNNKDIWLNKKETSKRLKYYFGVKSGEIKKRKKRKKTKKKK
jgi:ATP-dependent protease ClpP protease subunit